jgi:hypothetical protein
MKLTIFKKILRITMVALCISLFLPAYVFAYDKQDIVGRPAMLLTAVSNDGSLADESIMGYACADAILNATDAEISFVCGGELIANLEPKEQTYEQVSSVFKEPELGLATTEVTGLQLKEILENGFSHIVIDEAETIDKSQSAFAGFPQVSGIRVIYDASQPSGERVRHVYIDDKEIDLADEKKQYTLASTKNVFDGAYGYPKVSYQESNISLAEAMADYIHKGTLDNYNDINRVTAIGCTDYNIVNHFPLVQCVLAAMIIWIMTRLWKYKLTGNDYHRLEKNWKGE